MPARTALGATTTTTEPLRSEVRLGSVAESRQALLEEIGPAPELTFIRGYGNIGDELIWAGTRQLLSGHVYREIGIEELASSRGEVGLLCGGGAFCRSYNEFMPEALAIAELRFDRVIVLPSSFEVEEDRVRDVLQRTRATVFTREYESYRRVAGLCRARLAHDCAFFFDFSRYSQPGAGTLNAFRTDPERRAPGKLPDDNEDISSTCATLDEWLSAIARHKVVLTDRTHVMIAAAMLNKQVHYASNNYFKVDAIAAACLQGFPVQKIQATPGPVEGVDDPEPSSVGAMREHLRAKALRTPVPARAWDSGAARVTAVILSRDRPQQVVRAIGSVLASTPVRVLVLDQNSGQQTRAALRDIAAAHKNVDIRLSNRNLGAAGGRKQALELVDTEYVLFLDDDAELMPGALEHMVADLDGHPDAAAVTALVVYTDGTVYHFGGWVEQSSETVSFDLHGHRRQFDDPVLAGTGPSGWVPTTAALVRRQLFDEVPFDDRMASYFEDNDWCLRVELHRPGSFRRCREALAMHALPRAPQGTSFIQRAQQVQRLATHAQFLRTHGLLLENDLANLMPALHRDGGRFDYAAARLLLEVVASRGTDWTLMEWMNGGLDPLLDGGHREAELLRAKARALDEDAAGLRGELAVLREQALSLNSEAAALRGGLAETQEHANALQSLVVQAEEDRRSQTAHLAWLEQRHATLVTIEGSKWWRLGRRLAPARRALRALGQVARRDR